MLRPQNREPDARRDDKQREVFCYEESPWPFVHSVVPLAVYVLTRNFLLTLVLMYAWETLETVLGMFSDFFNETKSDALIGDIVIGLASVLVFMLFELAFDLRDNFLASVGLTTRISALVTIGVLSLIVSMDSQLSKRLRSELRKNSVRDNDRVIVTFRAGAIVYALLYLGLVVVFLHEKLHLVYKDLYVWLPMVLLYALVVTPVVVLPSQTIASAWLRVFALSTILILAATVTLVFCN